MWGVKIPTLQLMPMIWETLRVDVVKETPELIQARVYNVVPHNDLHAMNL